MAIQTDPNSNDFPDTELGRLAQSAIGELSESSPEQKAAFRRSFVFSLSAGILSSIMPDEETGIIVDPERAAVRERIRERMRVFILENPNETALTKLRVGQEALVDEYRMLASVDARFQPETEIAIATSHWTGTVPEIDEVFAQEILDYIDL